MFWLRHISALLLVAAPAAALMLWNLGARYFWQDEAATAVLAERLLKYGRPLGYDGRNLITMDWYVEGAESSIPSGAAAESIDYFVARGDFRDDTTWTGQPWGQFVLAAASMAMLGKSTWGARLPFALCGVGVAVVLYSFIRKRFCDPAMSVAALLLLLGNVYWVLHMRQCRYYAPASLLLLVTFVAYVRWRARDRWGGAAFVFSAWCFFQCDFGTFWPVMAVLTVDGLWSFRGRRYEFLGAMAALAALLGPWIWYYEILERLKPRLADSAQSVWILLMSFNQYQLPLIVMPVCLWFAWRARRAQSMPTGATHAIVLAAAIVAAILIWVPLVAPYPFYRYLAVATPLSCLLVSYILAGLIDVALRHKAASDLRVACSVVLAGLLLVTQVAAAPANLALMAGQSSVHISLGFWRPDLRTLYVDLRNIGPDPNREIVAELTPKLRPGDAVLTDVEDAPLMFYTDAEVRGGLATFRSDDTSVPPPRFIIIRSTGQMGRDAIRRQLARHTWRKLPVWIPAERFGNIPDPLFHRARTLGQDLPNLVIYELAPPERGGRRIELKSRSPSEPASDRAEP
ncbi:MAG: ArnT family glycosyltransferase [Pirellulales bacterium]